MAPAAAPHWGRCHDPARAARPRHHGPASRPRHRRLAPRHHGPAPGRRGDGVTSARAGQPATPADLVDVATLVTAYFAVHPDAAEPAQRVSFGTSGHRGSAFTATFNEDHIAATTQAICEYRAARGIDGPLYLGADTHALSEPAQVTALEVLAANGVPVLRDARGGYTPTPALSRAILAHNAA